MNELIILIFIILILITYIILNKSFQRNIEESVKLTETKFLEELKGKDVLISEKQKQISEMEERLRIEIDRRSKAETMLNERSENYNKAILRLEENFKESLRKLDEVFAGSAQKVLDNSNKSFLTLAKETMEKYLTGSKDDLEKRQDAINHMLKPLKESLDKQENITKELEKSTKETFGGMRQYLEGLEKSQNALERETEALVNALKSPKVRGKWGEIGLKRIVEFSGMSEYVDFTEQTSVTTDEDKRLRPDMIINLPGKRQVIVDSKVPLNSYLQSFEAEDEKQAQVFLTAHAKAVREHMKQLSQKSYWSQFSDSVDFVVLYIEVESAFASALISDKELILDGIKNRIIFATPTTLITMLKTIAFSWGQQDITDNAKRIWQQGQELYDRFVIFADHFSSIGKSLDQAVKNYNKTLNSYDTRLIPSIRKIQELGNYQNKNELPENFEVESNVKNLEKE